MKKINRLTFDINDTNKGKILKKYEMKKIKAGNPVCYYWADGSFFGSGYCAGDDLFECRDTCMNGHPSWMDHCECD